MLGHAEESVEAFIERKIVHSGEIAKLRLFRYSSAR